MKRLFCLIVLVLMCISTTVFAATPVLNYSDLGNGPATGGQGDTNGAFVTVWGHNFGVSQGTSYITLGGVQPSSYVSWSDTKVIFQIAAATATGAQTITITTAQGTSNALSFYVNPASDGVLIYFCGPGGNNSNAGTYASPWLDPDHFLDAHATGNILYVRAGTYTSKYGSTNQINLQIYLYDIPGTANKHNALLGYPGETVTFQWSIGKNVGLQSSDYSVDKKSYWTFANFVFDGNNGSSSFNGIDGGGDNASGGPESGGHDIRVVNCEFKNCSPENSSMTGVIALSGDNWKIYGCSFHDIKAQSAEFNNLHILYIRVGADNTDIGWSSFYSNKVGYQIQFHTDYAGSTYNIVWENNLFHHNYIKGGDVLGDARGVTVSDVDETSTFYFYNNIFDRISGSNCSICAYAGTLYVYNNTFYSLSPEGVICDICNGYYILRNNIIMGDGTDPYIFMGNNGGQCSTPTQESRFTTCENNLWYGGTGSTPSTCTGNQTTDPQFTNLAGSIFTIPNTSPAVDHGTSNVSATVTNDYIGASRPKGSAYDIGAYEYDSGAIPPSAQGCTISGGTFK